MDRRRHQFHIPGPALALGFILLLSAFVRAEQPAVEGAVDRSKPLLKITFIDVWQGDSILVEMPGGARTLIDAGEGSTEYASFDAPSVDIFPFLKRDHIGSNDIRYFVASHPHSDHIGGAITVLNRINFKTVYDTGMPYTTRNYLDFLKTVDSRGMKYVVPKPGDKLDWDPSLEVQVLNAAGDRYQDPNNSALVLRIVYGGFSVLLTGDIERQAEEEILSSGLPLRSTVLKAAHHASDTSSGQEFLDAVKPTAVVISVGLNNKFNHPSQETLDRYRQMGCLVYRTDRQGDITVVSDGRHFSFETEKTGP